jgi:tRNA threonylcarbamoyl adenosine modification protein (Sua5/YciO/YrdC/YwlC family)
MIEYIVPHNPDHRVLNKASEFLNEGQLIVLPTDTSWVAVCDPFTKDGLERLRDFKQEAKAKHFSILCDTISRASEAAEISDEAFRLIKRHIPGHYTFIFEASRTIVKQIKASKKDREIGLRFPPSEFVQTFIGHHGKVLASTNLTREMLGLNEEDEIYGYLLEDILSQKVKLVLDPGEVEFAGPSSIIRFYPEFELEREGAGPIAPFGL